MTWHINWDPMMGTTLSERWELYKYMSGGLREVGVALVIMVVFTYVVYKLHMWRLKVFMH